MGWIGVDLDGTLAEYTDWQGYDHIGAPVPEMIWRVKAWLLEGKKVKIFTARLARHGETDRATGKPIEAIRPIQEWCIKHLGQPLEVTCAKDFGLLELWDDRVVVVETNTGRVIAGAAPPPENGTIPL